MYYLPTHAIQSDKHRIGAVITALKIAHFFTLWEGIDTSIHCVYAGATEKFHGIGTPFNFSKVSLSFD